VNCTSPSEVRLAGKSWRKLTGSTPTPTLCSIVRWKRHLDKYYKELIIESNSIIEEETILKEFRIEMG
jgi:hypothetical protein